MSRIKLSIVNKHFAVATAPNFSVGSYCLKAEERLIWDWNMLLQPRFSETHNTALSIFFRFHPECSKLVQFVCQLTNISHQYRRSGLYVFLHRNFHLAPAQYPQRFLFKLSGIWCLISGFSWYLESSVSCSNWQTTLALAWTHHNWCQKHEKNPLKKHSFQSSAEKSLKNLKNIFQKKLLKKYKMLTKLVELRQLAVSLTFQTNRLFGY